MLYSTELRRVPFGDVGGWVGIGPPVSSSREVRIRVPFVSVLSDSVGEPNLTPKRVKKGTTGGLSSGSIVAKC